MICNPNIIKCNELFYAVSDKCCCGLEGVDDDDDDDGNDIPCPLRRREF